MSKIVLITGASSGMGRDTAIQLAQQGDTVYAAARRLDKLESLKEYGIHPVALDVTKTEECAQVVEQIMADQGRIDVLINNAGFGLYGPMEEVPLSDARYQFDVNLFGLADLTQKVLPYMRAQGSGRIINTSSMGGRIYFPLGSWYHATKHALEGWSDCLRVELKPFNIKVVVIQPGGVKTEFGDVTGAQLKTYADAGSAYSDQMDPFIKMMDNPQMMDRATPSEDMAKTFVKAVNAQNPKRRYVYGMGANTFMGIRRWLGDGFYEWFLARAMG